MSNTSSIWRLSSIPGISHAFQRTGVRSSLWYAIGVTGITLTCFHINIVVQDYFANPTNTKFSVEPQDAIEFPMVQVCSPHKLDCTRLKEQMDRDSENATLSKDFCKLFDLAKCARTVGKPDRCNSFSNEMPIDRGSMMYQLLDLWQMLPLTHKINISESKDFLLLNCRYNGEPCKAIRDYLPANKGLCITFNHDTTIRVEKVSENDGLILELRMNPNGHGNLVDKLGFEVTIQPPRNLERNIGTKYLVAPGTVTAFTVSLKKQERMQPGCNRYWNDSTLVIARNHSHLFGETLYDAQNCNELCQFEKTTLDCNCHWRYFDKFNLDNHGVNYYCKLSNDSVRSCVWKSYIEDGFTRCNCKPPCIEIGYDIGHSFAKWPSKDRSIELANQTGISEEEISQSVAKVSIYLSSLSSQEVREVSIYNGLADLLKALGGSLSFYMGLSFIMLFELLEILFDAIVKLWRKCNNKSKM